MTAKQEKVLAALLSQPTKDRAAKAAGVSVRTVNRYLQNEEFMREYRRASLGLVEDATRQLQQGMSHAVLRLRKIVSSDGEITANHIQAARALLDFGLRFTEINDILKELEGDSDVL